MDATLESELQAAGTTRVRLLALTLPLVLAAAIYVAAVAVDVAPASPAQVRLLPIANHLINPYFDQIWTLFAPTPPESQRLSYVAARYYPPGKEKLRQSAPLLVSEPAIAYAKSRRWAPSKLMSVPLYFEEVLYPGPQRARARIEKAKIKPALKRRALALLAEAYAPMQDQLNRYLSAEAAADLPRGSRIVSVRGVFVSVPMTAFSQRYATHPKFRKAVVLYDSDWRRYVPGVAQ